MKKFLLFVCFILFSLTLDARRPIYPSMNIFGSSKSNTRQLIEVKNEYNVKYYDQTIDHFTYSSKKTFKMRYLENLKYWNKKEKGFH